MVVYLSRAVISSIPARHFGMIFEIVCLISIQISRAMARTPTYIQPWRFDLCR